MIRLRALTAFMHSSRRNEIWGCQHGSFLIGTWESAIICVDGVWVGEGDKLWKGVWLVEDVWREEFKWDNRGKQKAEFRKKQTNLQLTYFASDQAKSNSTNRYEMHWINTWEVNIIEERFKYSVCISFQSISFHTVVNSLTTFPMVARTRTFPSPKWNFSPSPCWPASPRHQITIRALFPSAWRKPATALRGINFLSCAVTRLACSKTRDRPGLRSVRNAKSPSQPRTSWKLDQSVHYYLARSRPRPLCKELRWIAAEVGASHPTAWSHGTVAVSLTDIWRRISEGQVLMVFCGLLGSINRLVINCSKISCSCWKCRDRMIQQAAWNPVGTGSSSV